MKIYKLYQVDFDDDTLYIGITGMSLQSRAKSHIKHRSRVGIKMLSVKYVIKELAESKDLKEIAQWEKDAIKETREVIGKRLLNRTEGGEHPRLGNIRKNKPTKLTKSAIKKKKRTLLQQIRRKLVHRSIKEIEKVLKSL